MKLKNISMKQIRDFSRTSPILFTLGFTLLVVLVHETFSELNYLLIPDTIWGDILDEVVFLAWPVALVLIFGFGYIFRQKGVRATFGAALYLFLMEGSVVVFRLIFLIKDPSTAWKPGLEIFVALLGWFGVGFREEILYRGVNLNAIARKYGNTTKGLWITLLTSGVLFGAIHLSNVFHGLSFTAAVTQALSAVVGGILFGAIYLRGGNIWVVALLHALNDIVPVVTSVFTNSAENLTEVQVVSNYGLGLIQIIFLAGNLLLAAFLLRKSKRQKIFDRIEKLNSELAEF